jgi:hypothetical protein
MSLLDIQLLAYDGNHALTRNDVDAINTCFISMINNVPNTWDQLKKMRETIEHQERQLQIMSTQLGCVMELVKTLTYAPH